MLHHVRCQMDQRDEAMSASVVSTVKWIVPITKGNLQEEITFISNTEFQLTKDGSLLTDFPHALQLRIYNNRHTLYQSNATFFQLLTCSATCHNRCESKDLKITFAKQIKKNGRGYSYHNLGPILPTLTPTHDGRLFTDDIFKCIFVNENM